VSEEWRETTSDMAFEAVMTNTESNTGFVSIIGPESVMVFVSVV